MMIAENAASTGHSTLKPSYDSVAAIDERLAQLEAETKAMESKYAIIKQ